MLSQRWNNRGRITALKTFLYTKEFVLLDSTCASNLLSHLTWHSEMDVKKKKVLLWFFFIPQYWSKDQQFLKRFQSIVFQQRSDWTNIYGRFYDDNPCGHRRACITPAPLKLLPASSTRRQAKEKIHQTVGCRLCLAVTVMLAAHVCTWFAV